MRFTTPAFPVELVDRLPQLRPYQRAAVRLHPRPGSPGADDSSVGGPMQWPAGEPWPVCDGLGPRDHCDFTGFAAEDVPHVPVLQLRRADVANLPWPDDAQVLQVTWCPMNHLGSMSADVALHWRRAADLTGMAEVPVPDPEALTDLLPTPCTINPELIVEYPTWDLPTEIAAEIGPTIDEMAAETGWDYWHNAVAPGIKVGGYPSWTQSPDYPYCACGRAMDHLLSISSWEYDRGDDQRWITNEERPAIAASWADTDNQWDDDAPWRQAQAPAGMMIGDAGGIYIFVCTNCPAMPYEIRFDCS